MNDKSHEPLYIYDEQTKVQVNEIHNIIYFVDMFCITSYLLIVDNIISLSVVTDVLTLSREMHVIIDYLIFPIVSNAAVYREFISTLQHTIRR